MYDAVMACPKASDPFGERVFAPGGAEGPGGEGDSPDRPFVMIRAATNQPGIRGGAPKQQRFQVYVHDTPGDTTNIDDLQKELEDTVPGQAPVANAEGWIMDCVWEDTSGDGFDDHYGTTVRYVTFLVTWRPV
jgi:hypothetical protein